MNMYSSSFWFRIFLIFFWQTSGLAAQIQVQSLDFPSQKGKAIQLTVDPSGIPYAVWVETSPGEKQEISFSKWEQNAWSSPKLIYAGDRSLFANWIERPQLQFFAKHAPKMAASWLTSTDPRNSYSHDIHISISTDEGANWSPAQKPYSTKIPAYFGLTQMVPVEKDKMLIVWQDGRNTVQEVGPGRFYPRMGERLQLHSTIFDEKGQFQENKIFTDSISQLSPFTLQNNRHQTFLTFWTDKELNKKVASRTFKNGSWSSSKLEPVSNWALNFAPMDSPKATLIGKQNAFLWQQEVSGQIQLFLKISKKGKTLLEPIVLDLGAHYFGRFQGVWMDKKTLLLTWLSGEKGAYQLWAARINKTGVVSDKTKILDIAQDFPSVQPMLATTKTGALLNFALSEKESQAIYSFLLRKN